MAYPSNLENFLALQLQVIHDALNNIENALDEDDDESFEHLRELKNDLSSLEDSIDNYEFEDEDEDDDSSET